MGLFLLLISFLIIKFHESISEKGHLNYFIAFISGYLLSMKYYFFFKKKKEQGTNKRKTKRDKVKFKS